VHKEHKALTRIEATDMIHGPGDEACVQILFEVGDIQFMNQHVT
jgi:hypothetical protein